MTLIAFILVLSVLVLIHEAGHYFAARFFGVKAEEFGYGFPPRLIGFVKDAQGRWKRVRRNDEASYSNTIWSINWLPLGGFVRIKGEQNGLENDGDSIHAKPIWQRIVILAAGVIMNWILAVVLFSIVFMVGTTTVIDQLPAGAEVKDAAIQVVELLPGAPAEKAGLRLDDKIVSIGSVAPESEESARNLIASYGTSSFPIRVEREGQMLELQTTPEVVPELDRVAVGVGLANVGTVSLSPIGSIKAAVVITAAYTKAILWTFGGLLKDLVTWQPVAPDLSGPVGIAVMTGRVASQGVVPLLQFAAVLSINLAVINILPIPALDGGRVIFLLIEKIRRRSMSRALEAAIHNIAFLILISLTILITVRDVSRYGHAIVGGVKGLIGL